MTTATQNGPRRGWLGPGLAFPASLVVLAIIMVPILQLARYSFNRFDPAELMQSAFTFDNYAKFFGDPYYRDVFLTTLGIAGLCTVLALVLGFPVAYFLARTQSRYKSLFVILLVFPLMVGNVVRAAGWMVALGNAGVVNAVLQAMGLIDGPLTMMYTPTAVVIGTTAVVMPYLILTLQSVLEGMDLSVEEAARNVGASFFTTLRRIVLPIAAPGVAAGTMLVFILCMNAYATPVLLGGSGLTMMAPALYDQITKASNWPFGAALAVVLVCGTLVIALISNWLIHRRYLKTMAS
ncbi:ABC transporter permease [Achromobacter pulmonis]|jgi:putative spermidine/putrescine transport system permease protein|uniref:ABC transporter permease n=1 Tax=Achromobacter pulmonis TaxID=1389932 RepID=A0A2N8KD69_9BURK|nr:ABC transporter permease [Achromobacter pulmonis]MBO9331667.1 ABC transporter permease subunit [Achromobacter xylosoxidans]PND31379.1 ABC transporter permease [Achromobacter pulmonis]